MNIKVLGRYSLADCLGRSVESLAMTQRFGERSTRACRDDVADVVEYRQVP